MAEENTKEINIKNDDAQYQRMLKAPVGRLVLSLALPSVISMLISSIYNMADTYFVGTLGVAASGAVGVAFPLMLIIQAISFTFGMGANSMISRYLGARETKMAQRTAVSALAACIVINAVFSLISLSMLDSLLRVLGATESILPFARDYAFIILLGSPFISGSFVLNNLLRSQGLNLKAMIGLGIGGVINIILDPLFISVLNFGIRGAALATVISQAVSFFILIYMVETKSILLLRPRLISRKMQLYKAIVIIGIPSFLRQALGSLAVIILNNRAKIFGDPAVAAFTIVGRFNSIFLAFILGAGQGFQPVAGYNYGAKKFDRVKKSYTFSLKIMLLAMLIISGAMFALSSDLIAVFQPDPDVVKIGTFSLRLQCLTFLFQPFLIATNMLYQSTGHAKGATFLALLRNGIFYYPLVFTLPHFLKLLGVQLVQPLADILSALTAIPFGVHFMRNLDKKIAEQKSSAPQKRKAE